MIILSNAFDESIYIYIYIYIYMSVCVCVCMYRALLLLNSRIILSIYSGGAGSFEWSSLKLYWLL